MGRPCSSAILCGAVLLIVASATQAELVFTEIMYNPANLQPNWEWIEIHNRGSSPVDLSGYVFDDDDGVILSSANIASGIIAPGGVAVLFDDLDIDADDFHAAWGSGIQLIGVSDWPALNNTRDVIGLWDSLSHYDNRSLINATLWISYDDAAPWPSNDASASIMLNPVWANPQNAVNWSLSVSDVHGAYASIAGGGNLGGDIGSPGVITPEPASLACAAMSTIAVSSRRRPRPR